jgi:lipoate-protein ligase A
VDLYNLGKVSWQDSQLLYHALAYLGRESLVLLSPNCPYVCVGYHQDVVQEVDTDFCRERGIPVFRREVGGGGVYLDGGQLFFQLVLRKKNPIAPWQREAFYRKFLQAPINVYRRVGIAAEYKPVNDVLVGGRKISGTGAGEIGDCIVFVGNLILDFDYRIMSRVLKVPDEKFRDKVRKTLEDNLTTIRRELGEAQASRWSEEHLNELLAEEFGSIVGRLTPSERDRQLEDEMGRLEARMIDDAWLYERGMRAPGRSVRIRSGVDVVHRMHKAPGGLIRADFGVVDGRLARVSISGDFFCYPSDAVARLESMLEGRRRGEVAGVVREFCESEGVETPGISAEDWVRVLGA